MVAFLLVLLQIRQLLRTAAVSLPRSLSTDLYGSEHPGPLELSPPAFRGSRHVAKLFRPGAGIRDVA